MGFQQGLSGLNVSSKALDAIGNNVANSNTVGYKASQAMFADVYASSLSGGASANQVGIGASVAKVAQEFTQGTVTVTNNPLDLAINGDGMFRLSHNGVISFARNGQFQVDKSGFIVSPAGQHLTGYAADPITGAIVPGNYIDLQVNNSNIPSHATTAANVLVNLDSRANPPEAMTAGKLTGSARPGLGITAANNVLAITVDGVPASPAVTIPIGTYQSIGLLAAAVETAINTNPALKTANAAVTVTSDATTGFITIQSASKGSRGSQGTGSSVAVTAGVGATNLMGAASVTTDAADNFDPNVTTSYVASTAQTEYDSLGNAHNLTMYFVKTGQANTWQLYTALDGKSATTADIPATPGSLTATVPTVNTAATPLPAQTFDALGGVPLNLTMQLDGVTYSVPLTTTSASTTTGLQGEYMPTTNDANGDMALLATNLDADFTAYFGALVPVVTQPTVAYDATTGRLTFASQNPGGSSSVTFPTTGLAATDVNPASLLGVTPTETPGTSLSTVDVWTPTTLTFSSAGALTAPSPPVISQAFTLSNGATWGPTGDFDLDLTGTTQYGITFGVNQLTQDGFTSGRLSNMSVSADGTVFGKYSNGQSRAMGQVVLAKFNNPNGLASLGGNQWAETSESGQPIPGTPGQGSLGVVQAAAVEESNVDLTAELVAMITQQRVYQANAQTIKTQDQVLQTLVNLR